MAQLDKIDSNVTGLSFAEEESLKILPTTPVWFPLEPNTYADFGGQISTIARNPINASRQRKKGVTTDFDASGGFNTDITQENLQRILQGFFFADLRTKDELDVAVVTKHFAAASAVPAAGGANYLVGDILTLVGGTGTASTFTVATIDGGGAVVTVTLLALGNYTVAPSNPVATTDNSIAGAGATLTVTFTGGSSEYQPAAGGDGYVAGDLLFAKFFDDDGNNGLRAVTGTPDPDQVQVSGSTLVTASAQSGVISRVGFQFASGDATIDATGTLPALVASAKNLTQLDVIPGEWVFLGGDATAEKFGTPANNGFARVRSVTATRIEFDKTDATLVNDSGVGKTIRVFFGRVLKNELGTAIVRRTYQLERTLGAPDDSAPADVQAEYLIGAVPNEFTMNVKTADKINCDLSFVACDVEQVDAGDTKTGTRPALREADAFNTSSDFSRIKLARVVDGNPFPDPLFAFVQDLKITLANNLTPNKAVGVAGAFEVTAGTFAVSGQLTAYFANVTATRAVRNNEDITLDLAVVKDNQGFLVDLPLISLGDGRPKVEQDAAITLPLTADAATGAKIDPDLDHTMLMCFFDYMPDLADPS